MELHRFFASARELRNYNENPSVMTINTISDLSLVSNYTDKKNCATIEWNYNEENAEILIDYIKEHLKMCPRIELWNTAPNNDKDVVMTKCSKYILNAEKIKEIWGKESFEQTECLVVYNS